ncbi:hypothetical protein LCGC14_0946230 [marine sediment metagenome]|uniref:Uncharacterized protein n=1 Tax=marine sediment metagenome TaxID=412755 RepID=A0A0F9P4T0_9ZZZZ
MIKEILLELLLCVGFAVSVMILIILASIWVGKVLWNEN